jgi:purine-nucleoside phosphorylase
MNYFNIKRIIRIGILGATPHSIKIRDVILMVAAGTDSMINQKIANGYNIATSATFSLLHRTYETVKIMDIPVKIGNVFRSDLYYDPDESLISTLETSGVLGIDIEVAGFIWYCSTINIESLAILTISEHCLTGE